MRRRRSIDFTPLRLLGVIAIIAALAAILFPGPGQAREPARRPGSPRSAARLAVPAPAEVQVPEYEGLRSALADGLGRALVLGSRDGRDVPALEPPEGLETGRQAFRVYPDGHMQVAARGDTGYLTREPSGSGAIRVRCAVLDPSNNNQVWNFKAGPRLPQPAAGTQKYTLIVAPVSGSGRSVWLLTTAGVGGPLVVEKRANPTSPQELDQLPAGGLWDFGARADLSGSAGDNPFLLLQGIKRRGVVCAGLTYSHVAEYCDSSWKNPACAGNPAYWQSCAPHPSVSGMSQSCGHSA